jgi:hypothetical protein
LCNEVQPEGTKPSPYQVSGLSCYVPFHNIRDLPTFLLLSSSPLNNRIKLTRKAVAERWSASRPMYLAK